MKRTILSLLAAVVCTGVGAAPLRAQQPPCCTVAAIDARTGIVTGRVNANGQTFTFELHSRPQVATLRVGQLIYANLTSKQVSLDGKSVSGTMLSLSAPMAGRSAAPPSGAPVPRTLAPSAAPYLAHDVRILGVYSPAAENLNNEPDQVPSGVPVAHKVVVNGAAVNLASTRRLLSTDQGKQAIQQAAQRLGGIQMHVALLAGHKYMIADCLGVKASAGDFDVSIPAPQVSFGMTSATIQFIVSHIALNVLTIRLRPDLTDAVHPCHFSGRIGIGGAADNLTYSMTIDPLYNLQSCKLSNMNVLSTEWTAGSFSVAPLPSQVTGNARDMVVDALNYFTSFGVGDVFTQNLQDMLAQSVCKALS